MKMYMLIPLFLLFVVAAGCLGQPQTGEAEKQQGVSNETGVNAPVKETVKETPKIELTDYPTEINAGESASFKWKVSGAQGTVDHMAVHFGKASTPTANDATAPESTNYDHATAQYVSGSFAVPGEFSDTVQIDEAGTYYARAHTIVDGKNLWSDEVIFTVNGPQGQAVKEFTIAVSDAGFEPAEIEVKKGDLIKIHFEVASEGVQQNGVRIVSPAWSNAPALMPGNTEDVEFTAGDSFDYRLFWLAGNLLKATGKVTVSK